MFSGFRLLDKILLVPIGSIFGWGRSQAATAAHDAKILKMMQEDAIIKTTSGLPKRIALQDATIKHTVDLGDIGIGGVVPTGVTATNMYAMTGEGTSRALDDWKRLYNQYGGNPCEWQKLSGDVITDNFKYVVHWYERDGIQDTVKIKGVKRI